MEDIREKSRDFVTQSIKKTIRLVSTPENEYRENRREKIVKERKEDKCLGTYKNHKLDPPPRYVLVKI